MPSDLQSKLIELKIAAADSFMRCVGWEIKGQYYISSEDRYISVHVARPKVDGSGGGEIVPGSSPMWLPENFVEVFSRMRSQIDDLFAPWLLLPDPLEISPVVEKWRTITRDLAGAPSAMNSEIAPGGEICSFL